jgi:hypothetical protein
MVMRARYSNDVPGELLMKFLAYKAIALAKLNVGYSSFPSCARFYYVNAAKEGEYINHLRRLI